jgi:signal transduction histidine kinase
MILIVDDTYENIFSLKTLLEINRFEVDTAGSGEEALRKILRHEYSLIILDVQMPGMDGYEVAETITGYSKSRDIPILFLSAVHIDKRFISKGYTSGGVDYITKPFDPDLLLLKVKTFIRLYTQTKELSRIQASLEQKVEERTEELVKINRDLEESNAELQQYAYLASHDLQEPLRKIMTFSHLLRDKFLADKPDAGQVVTKIISSSERMRNLINDLLVYSKLSAAPQFVPCDLDQVLKDTLVDLEVSIREKYAVIHAQQLPRVEVIPGQIRQVFQNLVSNALKFARKDVTPHIKIWSEVIEKPGPDRSAPVAYARIFVEDNGIGFDEQYLDRIFAIFQRLHRREDYEGTGIGLAIVKKIIDKHNGFVSAKSIEGEGAIFIIDLPVKQLST